MCFGIGSPENHWFSVWGKWKIDDFWESWRLGILGYVCVPVIFFFFFFMSFHQCMLCLWPCLFLHSICLFTCMCMLLRHLRVAWVLYAIKFCSVLFCSGKGCTFSWDSLSSSPSICIGGLLLKERICSPKEQILSFKGSPKFEVIQLTPLK